MFVKHPVHQNWKRIADGIYDSYLWVKEDWIEREKRMDICLIICNSNCRLMIRLIIRRNISKLIKYSRNIWYWNKSWKVSGMSYMKQTNFYQLIVKNIHITIFKDYNH